MLALLSAKTLSYGLISPGFGLNCGFPHTYVVTHTRRNGRLSAIQIEPSISQRLREEIVTAISQEFES
jgi:hypothetical protein